MNNNKNLHGIVCEEEILRADVLLSSDIFPICKASGEKCIRCPVLLVSAQFLILSCCTALIQAKQNALSSVLLYVIHGHFSNQED